MEKGDIVLFYSKNIFSKIVSIFTHGKYSHSELLIDKNTTMKVYYRGIKEGVVKESQIGKDIDIYKPNYKSDKDKLNAVLHALYLIDKNPKYGYLNLIAFLFIRCLRKLKIRWFEGDKFLTCSEACADCLQQGKVKKNKTIPNSLLSPNSLPRVFDIKRR